MAQSRYESKQGKGKKPRSIFKITLITFLGVFLLAGGALVYMATQVANVTSSAQQDLERGERSEFREEKVNPSNEPISVLFLGLDTRDEDLSGRTDAMVLATFNPEEGSIKMLNIPRDSKVEIVGRYGEDKINHAHAFGGIDMTLDTVENMLDIPVDYFVSLNFDAFMEIIDELNGITVDSPMTFTETDNATYGTLTIEEGEQILNGEEALAYVRMRKSDPAGDLGRGERQKEVMESVIREVASFSSITNFNSLMDTVGRNLHMNMSFNDIVSMHSYANDLNNIESLSFDGTDLMQDGVYYYNVDEQSLEETSQRLQKHLGIIDEMTVASSVETDDEHEHEHDHDHEHDHEHREEIDDQEETSTTEIGQ
ncbi:LCP family protein [Salipaludibacillus daqingensis]|uniref:LCP family glycopolymer transferase n=1 Tax=Salipaludibacillus daqingensis TaxID=3041001 RepID=UPI0024763D73|nr:LCP family protein [Salipaludibacillus daqingensis]